MHSDPWEVGKTYPAKVGIIGDLKASLLSWRRSSAPSRPQRNGKRLASAPRTPPRPSRLRMRISRLWPQRFQSPAHSCSSVMQTIADAVPAETIIVDESITSGATLRDFLVRTTADSFYGMRGGGRLGTSRHGWGETGQARSPSLGYHRRRQHPLCQPGVVDGSTTRSVVWLICNNAQYMILKRRLHAYGGAAAKTETYIGLDMMDPEVDFLALARAMGVHGVAPIPPMRCRKLCVKPCRVRGRR